MAAALGLEPLPDEGGLFRRTYSSGPVTAIHYLVVAPDFSALHRLRSDELYFFHAGAPLRMLILPSGDDSRAEPGPGEQLLGPDPLAGHQPQLLVPARRWQGSSSTGGWSLVSTVVAPGFDWADFELGNRSALVALFPAWSARIAALTR